MKDILDAIAEGIFIIGPRYTIIDCNRALCGLLKKKKEDILNKKCYQLIHGKNRRIKHCLGDRAKEHGRSITSERWENHLAKNLCFSASGYFDKKNRFKCGVHVVKDITRRKTTEKRIKALLKEKEIFIKEIHHRVKNNLQVISSLINLQLRGVNDHRRAVDLMKVIQNRIYSISLVHEKLYQGENFLILDFGEYVRALIEHLFYSYGVNQETVDLKINARGIFLDPDTAVSCGLIINELVSNSLNHAFPEDRKGEVKIDIRADKDNRVNMIISDDGVGFPADLDFPGEKSLGQQLVVNLTRQLGGVIELERRGGVAVKITFDLLKKSFAGKKRKEANGRLSCPRG